jgi:alpha,alpha-trehalose phosphorylase
MRDMDGVLRFAPRLPDRIERLTFTIRHRGQRLRVSTDGEQATYTLFDHGSSMRVIHHGEEVTCVSGEPLTLAVPPVAVPPPVRQPYGREPVMGER